MTWEIVLGLIALVGFGISVISPIIKLNSSITKLNCSIDSLNQNMARNEARITHHGEQIDNHEHRITVLEEKGRLDVPGRPLLYGTTPDFLRCFGITGLQELPPLPQQEENGMEETTLDDVIEENESRSGE